MILPLKNLKQMKNFPDFFIIVGFIPLLFYTFILLLLIYKIFRFKRDVYLDGTDISIVKYHTFFLSIIAIIFLINFIINLSFGKELYGYLSSEYIAEMTIIKLYISSTIIPLIFMKEFGFFSKSPNYIIIITLSILLGILISDIFSYFGYLNAAINVMKIVAISFNLIIFNFILYKIVFFGRQYRFFISIGGPIKMVLIIGMMMLFSFIYLYYEVSHRSIINYSISVLLFMILHFIGIHKYLFNRSLFSNLFITDGDDFSLPILGKVSDINELSNSESEQLKIRLIALFEKDKPYLSKDISISEVAMMLYTNKTYLSKVINNDIKKNFRELVNYFRVREAIKIYSANSNISMGELCSMSGFNNIASFTSAFKLNTGYTPGEWKREIKNKKDCINEKSILQDIMQEC